MRKEISERLSEALSQIDRPGSFCVSGDVPTLLPGLEVEGLGPIGLPLTVQQAEELFMALKLLGRTVEFIRFPGEGHGLTRTGSPVHRVQRLELMLADSGAELLVTESALAGRFDFFGGPKVLLDRLDLGDVKPSSAAEETSGEQWSG